MFVLYFILLRIFLFVYRTQRYLYPLSASKSEILLVLVAIHSAGSNYAVHDYLYALADLVLVERIGHVVRMSVSGYRV